MSGQQPRCDLLAVLHPLDDLGQVGLGIVDVELRDGIA
jgi:hypothetical protein